MFPGWQTAPPIPSRIRRPHRRLLQRAAAITAARGPPARRRPPACESCRSCGSRLELGWRLDLKGDANRDAEATFEIRKRELVGGAVQMLEACTRVIQTDAAVER